MALGYVVYSFSSLEWVIAWTIEKLAPGFLEIHPRKTAGEIGQAFESAIKSASTLPLAILSDFEISSIDFKELVDRRNALIHSVPYTGLNGEQKLHRGELDWTIEQISDFNRDIDEYAARASKLYHSFF